MRGHERFVNAETDAGCTHHREREQRGLEEEEQ